MHFLKLLDSKNLLGISSEGPLATQSLKIEIPHNSCLSQEPLFSRVQISLESDLQSYSNILDDQKRAGMRESCIFSLVLGTRNKRDCERGSLFYTFVPIHRKNAKTLHIMWRECERGAPFWHAFFEFTVKRRGISKLIFRFFDPSVLKRSFFQKSAPLSGNTPGNRRQPPATAATAAP